MRAAVVLALAVLGLSGCGGSTAIGECGDASHPASAKDPVTGEPCSKVLERRRRLAPQEAREKANEKAAAELVDPNSPLHKRLMEAAHHLPAGASVAEIEAQAEREAAGK